MIPSEVIRIPWYIKVFVTASTKMIRFGYSNKRYQRRREGKGVGRVDKRLNPVLSAKPATTRSHWEPRHNSIPLVNLTGCEIRSVLFGLDGRVEEWNLTDGLSDSSVLIALFLGLEI
jgi:hypothetical protein